MAAAQSGLALCIREPTGLQMQIINNGETEWSTRVIVGKPSNQTYFFSDQMERVEFNPYWGVPQSIIKGEYLRRVQDNPSYFEQRGYEVLNSRGQRISGWDVDWWNYRGGIGVRQKPGPKNALGEVKFMFPNKHAIYLHDTPKRSLFKNDSRAYSHGCVRVQNPRELATQILGWSQDKIASTIATRKNTPVQLKSKLPVHLTYFTAWTDESGDLAYYTTMSTSAICISPGHSKPRKTACANKSSGHRIRISNGRHVRRPFCRFRPAKQLKNCSFSCDHVKNCH